MFPVTTEYEKSHFIVNSFYSGHRRALELVATLARDRNSGSLFQLNNHDLFLAGINLANLFNFGILQIIFKKLFFL